jgi:LysM repeat protein
MKGVYAMFHTSAAKRRILNFLLLPTTVASLVATASVAASTRPTVNTAGQPAGETPRVPAEKFSPSFLGMYRKSMVIESQIIKYSRKYHVDPSLARAVCMYESGGNPRLTSPAGARGYFQLMPATYRSLRVRSNIEAGVKYLGQLVRRFSREDYVLAAYNGGPTRVARGRAMPLETRQYVMGVRTYRSVLEKYGRSVRKNAHQLRIETVRRGDSWWRLSRRLKLPLVQLRTYNPFLAARTLRPGYRVVYPVEPRKHFLEGDGESTLRYRVRLGDIPMNLATILGVDLDALREANGLEPLQPISPGTVLEIPLDTPGRYRTYRVTARDSLPAIAQRMRVKPWSIVRDNLLWNQRVQPGMVLRIRVAPPRPKYVVYRVRRGDNLISIARRYHTTVRAIQRVNSMGRRTRIRIGQRIRIPRG